jgi:PAS domain S-box-containing protein
LVAGRLHRNDLTPFEWRDSTARGVAELEMTGTIQPYEKEYVRKDGSRVPVLFGAASFDETASQGVAFVVDLTERKRAEEAARRSEKELRDVIETIPAMADTLLPDGTIDFVNRKWLEFTGIAPSESTSRVGLKQFKESIHPADVATHVKKWLASLASGKPFENESRIRASDGEYRWFLHRAVPLRDDSGNILKWYGISTEIDDRKRAEEELRASESRFRTFVDNAKDAFFLHDDQLTILDVNQQACVSLGYSREELIGMHPRIFDVGLDEASIERLRQRVLAGETLTIETRHRRKDGTVFPVEIRTAQFEQGGRRRRLTLVRDITERKQAEEQSEKLRQLESDLAHMNRLSMMGELTASLAHEILHPIATARNNARAGTRFLEMKPPNLGEVGEALDCIVRDADRAKDIVDRVRDHVKKAPPRKIRFEINEAIEDVIVMARSAIDKNKVSVRTDFIANAISVEGDRVQLQQVILNLVLNAVEAMSSVEDGARELSIKTKQDQTGGILVAVCDSGPGIDNKHFERVFDPFYTTKTSGIGMGLSICRSIIAAHGGRLWVEANEPRGAAFRFTLPAGVEEP